MKSLRNAASLGKIRELLQRIKRVKNIEIVIAAVLALVAIGAYFGISFGKRGSTGVAAVSAEMTQEEKRIAETVSGIDGIGACNVLISRDAEDRIMGVIVVARGADSVGKRVNIIRCVEIATGAAVDKIQVYQMANGG